MFKEQLSSMYVKFQLVRKMEKVCGKETLQMYSRIDLWYVEKRKSMPEKKISRHCLYTKYDKAAAPLVSDVQL